MGVCFSYSSNNNSNNTTTKKNERLAAARVIWKSGEVREYSVAVTVEEVLSDHKKSNNSGVDEYFVCNSDSLYFDQLIPALNSDHQLSPNDIYFVLEASQRHRPLSAADMAALALKATASLDDIDKKTKTKKKKKRFSRVSPQQQQPDIDNYFFSHPPPDYDSDRTIGKARGGGANNNNNTTNNNKLPRSSSMKKLQRLTSRRAKLAVRSFRLHLSTIYEYT